MLQKFIYLIPTRNLVLKEICPLRSFSKLFSLNLSPTAHHGFNRTIHMLKWAGQILFN